MAEGDRGQVREADVTRGSRSSKSDPSLRRGFGLGFGFSAISPTWPHTRETPFTRTPLEAEQPRLESAFVGFSRGTKDPCFLILVGILSGESARGTVPSFIHAMIKLYIYGYQLKVMDEGL